MIGAAKMSFRDAPIIGPAPASSKLFALGYNNIVQLGVYTGGYNASSPIQVGSDIDWASVVFCDYSAAAIKTTGSLWVCGLNNQGQLGLGDVTNRTNPVQVGAETDW